jgi:hypothetical protein
LRDTCVLIPYRGGCPHRERALAFVLSKLATYGWPVVIGRHDDGAWCKATAVADALAQTDADTLLIHDADVVCHGLPEAVEAVQAGASWAIPHRSVHRLTEASSARYMAGESHERLPLAQRAYKGVEGGGIVVVRRAVYEDCPLDRRFVGWGQEDESFGWALLTLHGKPSRHHTALIHLWHPVPQRISRAFGSEEGIDLRKRYANALRKPDAMRALIAEQYELREAA